MRDLLDRGAALLLLALGAVHTLLTPILVPPELALWFAGSGLSLVFLALLNLARRAAPTAAAERLCFAANLLGCGFTLLVLKVVPQPQAFAAAALMGVLTLASMPAPHRLLPPSTGR